MYTFLESATTTMSMRERVKNSSQINEEPSLKSNISSFFQIFVFQVLSYSIRNNSERNTKSTEEKLGDFVARVRT